MTRLQIYLILNHDFFLVTNVINDNDLVPVGFYVFNELVEQIRGIVWTRTGFGMVLHRETILRFHAHTSNGLIVEMYVCNFEIWVVFECFSVDCKTVILGRDFAFSRNKVHHGMIYSSVPIEHFVGGNPIR